MKKSILLLLLPILFIQCKKSAQERIDIINSQIKQLKNDKVQNNITPLTIPESSVINLIDLLSKDEQKSLLDKLRIKVYLDMDGEPVTIQELKDNYSYPNPSDLTLTKYIYFYKEDFDRLLAAMPMCTEQRGIRIKLATFKKQKDSNQNAHPYFNRNTVILQSMCGNTPIELSIDSNATYDYGDVCPPNCNNLDIKGARKSQQVKDGVFSKQ